MTWPSPEQLCCVRVQLETVGRHTVADFLDAVLRVVKKQTSRVDERVETDAMFRDVVFKIRRVQYKQTRTEHWTLWYETRDVDGWWRTNVRLGKFCQRGMKWTPLRPYSRSSLCISRSWLIVSKTADRSSRHSADTWLPSAAISMSM